MDFQKSFICYYLLQREISKLEILKHLRICWMKIMQRFKYEYGVHLRLSFLSHEYVHIHNELPDDNGTFQMGVAFGNEAIDNMGAYISF